MGDNLPPIIHTCLVVNIITFNLTGSKREDLTLETFCSASILSSITRLGPSNSQQFETPWSLYLLSMLQQGCENQQHKSMQCLHQLSADLQFVRTFYDSLFQIKWRGVWKGKDKMSWGPSSTPSALYYREYLLNVDQRESWFTWLPLIQDCSSWTLEMVVWGIK